MSSNNRASDRFLLAEAMDRAMLAWARGGYDDQLDAFNDVWAQMAAMPVSEINRVAAPIAAVRPIGNGYYATVQHGCTTITKGRPAL